MGTLVFVCPTTGHEVSTGVEIDRSSPKPTSGAGDQCLGRAALYIPA